MVINNNSRVVVNKISPEVKTQWICALRSGEYEQQRDGVLSAHGGYCCLGLLARITGKLDRSGCYNGASETWLLAQAGDQAGDEWDSSKYEMVSQEKQWELGNLNDRGFSFSEIADIIEEDEAI